MSTSDLVSLGFVIALSALVIGGAIWAGRRSKDPAALVRGIRERRWPIALIASGAAIALTGAGMVMHASRAFRLHVEEIGFTPIDEPVRLIPESRRERSQAGSVVALAGVALLVIGWVWLRRRGPVDPR